MRLLLVTLLSFASAAYAECPCQPDSQLLRLTRHYEGLRLFSYDDAAGHGTIGFGHLIKSDESFEQPITGEQAEALLEEDEAIAGEGVNRLVTASISQGQWDGLTDFCFNLGSGTLSRSTLLKQVNAGEDASSGFMAYDKARIGGKLTVLGGLFSRRKAELSLYEDGR